MKKHLPLYIYGAVIIFAGVFLLFSNYFSFQSLKYFLGITLIIAALLAFIKAFSRERKQIEFAYHEIHSLTMLVYGVSVLVFANALETLLYLSTFLMFFYAFSEIIFCNWLFNLRNRVLYKIIFIRIALAILTGIGTIVIMHYYFNANQELSLEGFGIIFILIGINILLYVPVVIGNEINKPLE